MASKIKKLEKSLAAGRSREWDLKVIEKFEFRLQNLKITAARREMEKLLPSKAKSTARKPFKV